MKSNAFNHSQTMVSRLLDQVSRLLDQVSRLLDQGCLMFLLDLAISLMCRWLELSYAFIGLEPSMKVRLREIKVVALNTSTIILLTQFVRLARVREGADLRMQQPDIIKKVFRYAANCENPDLIVLHMHIKNEMTKHIQKCNLEKPSFNMHHEVA